MRYKFKTSKIMEALLQNTATHTTFNKDKLLQTAGIFVPILGYTCIRLFKNEMYQIFDFQSIFIKALFSFLLVWIVLAVAVLYSYFVEKRPFLIIKETKRSWKFYAVSFITLFILTAVVSTVSAQIIKYLGFNMHSRPSVIDFNRYPVLILIASVTAGVCEELLFRGFIMTRMANIFGNKNLAILLSSVLFAIGHYTYGTVVEVVNPFLIGLIFAATYFRYRNIKLIIALHIVWDIMAISLFS